MEAKSSFSQRHPYLFGTLIILAAAALLSGLAAALRTWGEGGELSTSLGSEKIGIVRVEGDIFNTEPITKWIRELGDDATVKGVVVRINSPGGLVAPSQELFLAIRKLAEKKPVVASMGSVAASGGYYAAVGARYIMANPGTLTGSIGVKADIPNVTKLLEKVGVDFTLLASGKLKNAGSPYKEITPEQREYLQALIMDMHQQFVGDVAEARQMELAKVEAVADGRALTGRQAKEAGLVDELGGYHEAIAHIRKECDLHGKIPLRDGPPRERANFLREVLSESVHDVVGELLRSGGPRAE